MKKILTIILLNTVTLASAQIVVPDQSSYNSTYTPELIYYARQTFTCGITGYLNRIDVWMNYSDFLCSNNDSIVIQMLATGGPGYSDSVTLYNSYPSLSPQLVSFTFTNNQNIIYAGNQYQFTFGIAETSCSGNVLDGCGCSGNNAKRVMVADPGTYQGGAYFFGGSPTIDRDINFATYMQPIPGVLNPVVCNSYVSPSGNYTWTQSGTYTDTIPSSQGYDSLIVVNLTINNATSGTDVHTACNSYTWIDGNTYTSSNNTATHTLTNAVGCDSIITLNLTINNPSTGTDVQTACESYTWIDGNTYTSGNNTATHTLTNTAGCDSIITLNLTIDNLDISVTENGSTLTANESSATYQWIDCSNNQPVLNETNQSFTVTQSGNYAVIVTQGGCTDTSACYNVTITGVTKNLTDVQFTVYPNPVNDFVTITNLPNGSTVNILDVTGKAVYSSGTTTGQTTINTAGFTNGIYLIRIDNNGNSANKKLVINK